jgi:hypothetical protein
MSSRAMKYRGLKPRRGSKRAGNVQAAASAQVLIYHPGRNRMPLPPILQTEFWCEAEYKIPIATASITTGTVKLNEPYLPFRPGGSSAFPTLTFMGPATESTLQPTGASSLFGTIATYGGYRVIKSTLSIRWNGSNSGNNIMAVVVPALNTTSIASVYAARTYPFAKQASFSVSKANTNCDRDGWFNSSISPYVLLGVDRAQAEADAYLNLGFWGSSPPLGFLWNVFLQSNDADVSSSTASTLQVRLHQVVQALNLDELPPTLRVSAERKEDPVLVQTSCSSCCCKKPP